MAGRYGHAMMVNAANRIFVCVAPALLLPLPWLFLTLCDRLRIGGATHNTTGGLGLTADIWIYGNYSSCPPGRYYQGPAPLSSTCTACSASRCTLRLCARARGACSVRGCELVVQMV